MSDAAYIAGDCGTTHSRFWLCDSSGTVLDRSTGDGVSSAPGEVAAAATFDKAVSEWPENVPAVLCGMIGSTIGWREARYLPCPASLKGMSSGAMQFRHGNRNIAILPGLQTVNQVGQPDLMRGEETQVVGAVSLTGWKNAVFLMPGTHNKWVVVEGGRVTRFHTAVTGELFAALSQHSVLISPDRPAADADKSYDAGLRLALDNPEVGLESLLFAVRARQVTGMTSKDKASAMLSGLIIGSDVISARKLFGKELANGPIATICSERLTKLYARALEYAGFASSSLAGEETVRRGLYKAYEEIYAFGS